ncbi:MAG: hypothetical protein ACREJQ_04420 [bacterium]
MGSKKRSGLRRKHVVQGVLLAFLLVVVGVRPVAAPLPTADRITPDHGRVGHTAIVHGENLRGSSLMVLFGTAVGTNPQNPGNSAQVIKVNVPDRAGADPNPVVVRVWVDGVEAEYPNRPLMFEYL